MLNDIVGPVKVALVGFEKSDHAVIAASLRESGIYHEWHQERGLAPGCILLNAEHAEANLSSFGKPHLPPNVPTVSVNRHAVGKPVLAHLNCRLRWNQAIETVAVAVNIQDSVSKGDGSL